MMTHPCIDSHENIKCSGCAVYDRGFCDAFRVILKKIAYNLNSRYTGIPTEEQNDILAITVESVVMGTDRFEGRHGAKFSTWVWQIYRNKLNDYFRGKKAVNFEEITEHQNYGWHDLSHETEKKMMLVQCFEKYLSDDDSGCVRLYFDLYRFLQKGKTQKDLAEDYQVAPNTLNQRIKRCRKIMKHLFKACLETDA